MHSRLLDLEQTHEVMITTAMSVSVFTFALFLSIVRLQNFIEISKTGRDAQPNVTYALTWLCTLLWSVFFMLQTNK